MVQGAEYVCYVAYSALAANFLYDNILFRQPPKLRPNILAFFCSKCVSNSILFQKNKVLGSILPTVILFALVSGIIYIVSEMSQNKIQSIEREKERAKQGYVQGSNDYKVINNKVYHRDTLIVGADAKTFEIVSWNWQRDKNYYYFFGKKIQYIDRKSFKDLNYHYGKDKFNVYYDEKIIKGADAKTFTHIDGTQDGKDTNSCYRWGEKVDCKVLKVEE
jgi:hypothetical protein